MKGSMRNRLGRTTASFARNSRKVCIPYVVALDALSNAYVASWRFVGVVVGFQVVSEGLIE